MKLEIKPSFLASALDQELPVRKGIKKALRILGELSYPERLAHQGVHLEKIVGLETPEGDPQHTFRATHAARGIAALRGDTLILLYIEADHDKVYR